MQGDAERRVVAAQRGNQRSYGDPFLALALRRSLKEKNKQPEQPFRPAADGVSFLSVSFLVSAAERLRERRPASGLFCF